MTYILVIYTVIACGPTFCKSDWRPIGEFHMEEGRMGKKTAREMCEDAARQLSLKTNEYRCIQSK